MWAAGYQAEKVKSYFKRKYCWFYDLGFLTASELHNESLRNPTKQILNEGHAEYRSEDQLYLQNLSAIYKLSLRIKKFIL